MSRVIYKFKLDLMDLQLVSMSRGANVLCAQMQGDDICMWAEVDTDTKKCIRKVFVIGTGHPVPNLETQYIGTVQHNNYVWHIYIAAEPIFVEE